MADRPLTIAFVPGLDRFEDFHDTIGVSFEAFGTQLTGGWLFNDIKALQLAGVRTILIYTSARVERPHVFTHEDTGAPVFVLPSPFIHKVVRRVQRRLLPDSTALAAVTSYLSTPVGQLARLLRRQGCGAILCQEYEDPRFDICCLLGRLLHRPVFATFQGADHTRSALERALRPFSMRRCGGLIIPSRAERDRVRQRYAVPEHRIADIPNPVELVTGLSDRSAVRRELALATTTRVVVWHGRVQIDKKGLDVLLDAWDLVCAQRPDADIRLLLVGSGRNAERLRRRLQSSTQVLWIDEYVFDRSRLWSYLIAADIYVMPSRREGFAVAPLEAMACGLPIVATDAVGVIDALPQGEKDGGIIVRKEDAPALAGALIRLIDNPLLASALGAIGRRRVEDEFSLHAVGQRLRKFIFGTEMPGPRRSSKAP